jgi:exodeoxyribonuclease VII small subunit
LCACANLKSYRKNRESIVAEGSKKKLELEKAMSELEEVVEQLENGELTLDKSLKQFEKGVKLSRECQQALTAAEQKVQILLDADLKEIDPDNIDSGAVGATATGSGKSGGRKGDS